MTPDLSAAVQRLRDALALRPTEGVWKLGDTVVFCDGEPLASADQHGTAALIAACGPDTIRLLLDALESQAPAQPLSDRDTFERYFAGSRKSKGVAKRPTFERRTDDDTYLDDHTQRHWWTWQQAVRAQPQEGKTP